MKTLIGAAAIAVSIPLQAEAQVGAAGGRAITAQNGGARISLRSYRLEESPSPADRTPGMAPVARPPELPNYVPDVHFVSYPAPPVVDFSVKKPAPTYSARVNEVSSNTWRGRTWTAPLDRESDRLSTGPWNLEEPRDRADGIYVKTRGGEVLVPSKTWASEVNLCHSLTQRGSTPLDRQARGFLLGLRMASTYRSSPGSLTYNELRSAIDQEKSKAEATLLTCQVVLSQAR